VGQVRDGRAEPVNDDLASQIQVVQASLEYGQFRLPWRLLDRLKHASRAEERPESMLVAEAIARYLRLIHCDRTDFGTLRVSDCEWYPVSDLMAFEAWMRREGAWPRRTSAAREALLAYWLGLLSEPSEAGPGPRSAAPVPAPSVASNEA
jgi:hypothetical protein